jgi:hypothetical protein
MRKPVFALLALLALVPFARSMAQTPPAAAPATGATAQFLATLSAAPAPAPTDLTPAPSFLASCTSSAQCATGQLCCNVCGTPPEGGGTCRACVTPIRGRCPLVS